MRIFGLIRPLKGSPSASIFRLRAGLASFTPGDLFSNITLPLSEIVSRISCLRLLVKSARPGTLTSAVKMGKWRTGGLELNGFDRFVFLTHLMEFPFARRLKRVAQRRISLAGQSVPPWHPAKSMTTCQPGSPGWRHNVRRNENQRNIELQRYRIKRGHTTQPSAEHFCIGANARCQPALCFRADNPNVAFVIIDTRIA